tara:strand:- start:896 stop:1636 length:741 start_codon:yes stop_codon:yes gene_type:complete
MPADRELIIIVDRPARQMRRAVKPKKVSGLMPQVHNQTKMSDSHYNQATVYVVDDEPTVRQSLQSLCTSEGWQVKVYADGTSFLNAVSTDNLGCVVLDMKLPGMDGLQVHEEMIKRRVTLPVLFYTGFGTVQTATTAMKHGALDFLEKNQSPDHLIDSIRNAIDKHNHVIAHQRQAQQVRQMLDSLTPRESEVLTLVMEGQTSREIATQLHRSEKTIQLHRANIMKKFNVRRVVDLINLVTTAEEA